MRLGTGPRGINLGSRHEEKEELITDLLLIKLARKKVTNYFGFILFNTSKTEAYFVHNL
jgi:hypothetical protein